jgi:manganese oxidase
MNKFCRIVFVVIVLTGAMCASITNTYAVVDGIAGTTFNLTARTGHISTADGNSVFIWGFAFDDPFPPFCPAGGCVQYPGPTLIVNQNANVTVNLTNNLTVPVSIVFPGQSVSASGGVPGFLTNEAPPGGTVQYSFTASNPGTYAYHSGTNPDLQVEMGLTGALIVRPTGYNEMIPATYKAYSHADSNYDREYLFFLSEIDPDIHQLVEFDKVNQVDTTTFFPNYWFENGRNLPDTMADAYVAWLPSQPYNCMPMMHPGEKVLLRFVGGNRASHPLHTHGNNHLVIAKDGRLLESAPGAGADLSESTFTTTVYPGGTADAIFTWTGEKLGWDIYGHTDPTNTGLVGAACTAAGASLQPGEYEPDHCKPIPVNLPDVLNLTIGPFYSGSPFLGQMGSLPPGTGGFNAFGGLFFMWHSHNERELTNFNIFPGGMATMAVVEPPGAPIMP